MYIQVGLRTCMNFNTPVMKICIDLSQLNYILQNREHIYLVIYFIHNIKVFEHKWYIHDNHYITAEYDI